MKMPTMSRIALTLGLIWDYTWTGWQPLPLGFCDNVLLKLKADSLDIPREIQNDCDAGDRAAISNAMIEGTKTVQYIEKAYLIEKYSVFVSVGDNFYNSGVALPRLVSSASLLHDYPGSQNEIRRSST